MPRQHNCNKKPVIPDPAIRGGKALVRSEIEQRINEFAFAIDAVFNAPTKTPEGLVVPLTNYLSFFTDQVTFIDNGVVFTSKEQIAEFLTVAAIGAIRYSLHSIVNPDIQALSPTQALVKAHLIYYLRIQLEGAISNVFANLGNYQLEWFFENGIWKIRRFVFTVQQVGLGFGSITPSV